MGRIIRIGSANLASTVQAEINVDYHLDTARDVLDQVDHALDILEDVVHQAGNAGCDVIAFPESTILVVHDHHPSSVGRFW